MVATDQMAAALIPDERLDAAKFIDALLEAIVRLIARLQVNARVVWGRVDFIARNRLDTHGAFLNHRARKRRIRTRRPIASLFIGNSNKMSVLLWRRHDPPDRVRPVAGCRRNQLHPTPRHRRGRPSLGETLNDPHRGAFNES